MPKAVKFLTATAVTRIRRMIDYVRQHPEKLDQDAFPCYNNGEAICGTAFCAAGHIVFAQSPTKFNELVRRPYPLNWTSEANKALGIENKLYHEPFINRASWLIFGNVEDWPNAFAVLYEKAESKLGKKQLAGKVNAFAARWEAFIATDGADMDPDYVYPRGVVKAAIKAGKVL